MSPVVPNRAGAEVFISYAQDEDHAAASALADRLEGVGATVWIAERSIEGAQNYADEIVAAIDACKVVVALCSHASMQSRHVAVELSLAFEAGRPRLPLVLDGTPFPGQVRYWLADANRIDISGDADTWFPKVERALQRLDVDCNATGPVAAAGEDDEPAVTVRVERTDAGAAPATGVPMTAALEPPPRNRASQPGSRASTGIEPRASPRGSSAVPARSTSTSTEAVTKTNWSRCCATSPNQTADAPSFPAKFNRIARFAGGPQRDDKAFAETYEHHTPGSLQHEAFDSFSTIWLGQGADLDAEAVPALARILHRRPRISAARSSSWSA